MDFAQLESQLEAELDSQMEDLKVLEEEHDKIGNPATIGETVKNVVWEQFINQVGVIAGEDFIRENRGLTLDLRDSAHIQTTENFEKGKIATHNDKIDYQKRYDDWQANFQRNEDGSVKMERARITGEQQAKLKNGARQYLNGPSGSASMHNDHTISAAEIIRDPEANAHLSREEQHDFATGSINYKPLDSSANESKGDARMDDWLNHERNGQRPAERFNINEDELKKRDAEARAEYERIKKEGEKRSIETGKKSQREEAFRIGGKALRSVIMGLLASLVKDIIQKLVAWFRSGKRSLSTFIDSVKLAIKSFLSNMKTHLLNAGNTLITTIFTAIFGPVIGMIKKAWIFLKQGYKSVKEAIEFFKNPANKNMPFSIKMMEVGKIIVTGATAGGAILLGETIEKGLMTIPVFAFQIPLLGSLASLLGMFFGALISGLIGALALNLIDKMIAKKQRSINQSQQINKKNDIINSQEQILVVTAAQAANDKKDTAQNVMNRHQEANDIIEKSTSSVDENLNAVNDNEKKSEEIQTRNTSALDEIDDILNNL
ncbi:cation diffusion facilitator family transporter [Segatella sp.]|uniref:cation diffusion facilitator family transporter n=1 Tax=Segatella sp. TaxID=2974253 RepID=UPI003AAEE5F2